MNERDFIYIRSRRSVNAVTVAFQRISANDGRKERKKNNSLIVDSVLFIFWIFSHEQLCLLLQSLFPSFHLLHTLLPKALCPEFNLKQKL